MLTDLTEFKSAIKENFYTKKVFVYSSDVVKDSELFTRIAVGGTADSFMANVQFSNFENIQEMYGIRESIDISITTDKEVEKETIIGYMDKFYKVTKVIPTDTHYLIVGKKWLSRSLTSISA